MLFPGDAQIENWSYALTSPEAESLRSDLGELDLYKVGHHGSRNATPKQSLFPLLKANAGGTSLAVMSTMPGVFKDANPVPSKALTDAFSAAPFRLVSTADIPATQGPPVRHVTATPGTPFLDVPA
jgi:hypothetical protein